MTEERGSQEIYNAGMEAARAAFKVDYAKGGVHQAEGAAFKTFSIDVSEFDPFRYSPYEPGADGKGWHYGKIAVHGDEALRDLILSLLLMRKEIRE